MKTHLYRTVVIGEGKTAAVSEEDYTKLTILAKKPIRSFKQRKRGDN